MRNAVASSFLFFVPFIAFGQQPANLKEAWTASEGISNPESALYVESLKTIFVSNVAGGPTDKDGKGWISKLDENGKVVTAQFVSGLNAPKGLGYHKGMLYVTDLGELLVIDAKSGKIKKRIELPGVKFSNDVSIAKNGDVFVSDTLGNTLYKVTKKGAVKFAEGEDTEAPNGVFVDGKHLVVAGWGKEVGADFSSKVPGNVILFDLKTGKRSSVVTKAPLGNLDGIEKVNGDTWLVSDWMAGKVFKLNAKDGTAVEVVSGLKGAADIGYIAAKKIVIVPRMNEDKVTGYLVE